MVDSSRYQLSMQVSENAWASGWESYRVVHTVRAANCLNGRRTPFVKAYIKILFSINKQIFVILLLSASIRRRVIIDEVDEILEVPVISLSTPLVDYRKQFSHISVTGCVNPGMLSSGASEK